jgi:hypothetical protein
MNQNKLKPWVEETISLLSTSVAACNVICVLPQRLYFVPHHRSVIENRVFSFVFCEQVIGITLVEISTSVKNLNDKSKTVIEDHFL